VKMKNRVFGGGEATPNTLFFIFTFA
jgi:hypothetical protein